MDIGEKAIEELKVAIDALPMGVFLKATKDEGLPQNKEEVKDFLSEDYSYVLHFLYVIGIRTVKADVYCPECGVEREDVDVDTDTWKWACPDCGSENEG